MNILATSPATGPRRTRSRETLCSDGRAERTAPNKRRDTALPSGDLEGPDAMRCLAFFAFVAIMVAAVFLSDTEASSGERTDGRI